MGQAARAVHRALKLRVAQTGRHETEQTDKPEAGAAAGGQPHELLQEEHDSVGHQEPLDPPGQGALGPEGDVLLRAVHVRGSSNLQPHD